MKLLEFLALTLLLSLFTYTTYAFSNSLLASVAVKSNTESTSEVNNDAKTKLPENSLYQIKSEWQNQDSERMQLKDLAGKKQIVSLIYTHCQHTCPIIVENMKMVDKSIPDNKKHEYAFVLISLTPETDTPEVLKQFAQDRKLDNKRWTLLRGDEKDVHLLAMALETEYKKIANNEVSHSNLISILDEQGQIMLQAKGTSDQALTLIKKIQAIK